MQRMRYEYVWSSCFTAAYNPAANVPDIEEEDAGR